jgi:hypothetical protein
MPKQSSSASKMPDMNLKLTNIGVKFNKNNFLLKYATANAKNNILKAKLHIDDCDFNLVKKDTKIELKSNNINYKMINKLLDSNSFIDGRVSLKIFGTMKNLKGHVNIYNTTIKNMTLLNNIFAFLNTIPAILTLDFNAGYNSKGYYIKKGSFDFTYANSSIFISNIALKSDSFNIKGNGAISLDDKDIDMSLNIKFLKGLSNKTIQINGKLDNPQVSLFK